MKKNSLSGTTKMLSINQPTTQDELGIILNHKRIMKSFRLHTQDIDRLEATTVRVSKLLRRQLSQTDILRALLRIGSKLDEKKILDYVCED